MPRSEDHLRTTFHRTDAAEAQREEPSASERSNPERTTSAAKDIDLEGQARFADGRTDALAADFDRARDDSSAPDTPPAREAEMVNADAPGMHLRPDNSSTKNAGTRETHNNARSKDDQEARDWARASQKQKEFQSERDGAESERDHANDNDR